MKVKATIENGKSANVVMVDIDARDRRAFEIVGRKEFGIPSSVKLQDAVQGIPESYIGWLCWHALTRVNGNATKWGTWKEFELKLLRTESIEEEEEAFDFPTQ